MRKIPTLFVRDFDNDHGRYVTREVTPGCEWVLAAQGIATRKWNGTCFRLHEGSWWARREVKRGKIAPDGFIALETDETTGKTVGWEPAENSGFYGALLAAVAATAMLHGVGEAPLEEGTYELCGPSVNGDPEGLTADLLIRHGYGLPNGGGRVHVPDRSYDGLVEFLGENPEMEGLVFYRTQHQPESGMVKIKRRDLRELA